MPSVRYAVHPDASVVQLLDDSGVVMGLTVPDPNLAKDISTVANAIIATGNPALASMTVDFFEDLFHLMA